MHMSLTLQAFSSHFLTHTVYQLPRAHWLTLWFMHAGGSTHRFYGNTMPFYIRDLSMERF